MPNRNFITNRITTVVFVAIAAIAMGFLYKPTLAQAASSWYSTSWLYRKAITIDYHKVASSTAETYANFPVLVNLASDAGLSAHASSTGADIMFTSSDGITKLNHEIEKYASSTGQLTAWVNVGSSGLSTSTNTTLYMYYGNPTAADQQNASGVWDSHYAAVYHFSNGSTLNLKDSTANGNNLINNGASAGSGQIDGAITTGNGTNAYANSSASLAVTGDMEIEAWANPTSVCGYPTIAAKIYSQSDNSPYPYTLRIQSCGYIGFGFHDNGGQEFTYSTTTVVTTGALQFIAATKNGSTSSVYYNGALNNTGTINGPGVDSGYNLRVGDDFPLGDPFYGQIDELRISNIPRSASWIATEYNNELAPSTFYALGTQQIDTYLPLVNSFTASPNPVSPNQPSMLSWNVNNADSLSIDNGIGAVSPVMSGSASFAPATTTTYTLLATNSNGTTTASVLVTVNPPEPPPTPPQSLTAVTNGSEVDLSWQAPSYNGGSVVIDYLVEYKLASSSSWSTFAHAPSTATAVAVTGLAISGVYNFRVSAVNSLGTGVPSSTASVQWWQAYIPGVSWYNTSWTTSQAITIAGSTAGVQTDYQVKIVVPYASPMNADFSDVRFTGADGITLINYWLESETNSTTATFWVKVPIIPASPATTAIYMYYGNSSATTLSNGSNTFNFFDTFGNGDTPGDWNWSFNTIGEHGTIKNGKLYAPLEDQQTGNGSGLVILNPATGTVIKHFIFHEGCLEAAPAIDNNGFIHVYGCDGGTLYKIDENTGVVRSLSFYPSVDWEKVPYDSTNDEILGVINGTGLRAVKASDYSTIWTNTEVNTTGGGQTEAGPPLLVNGYAYWQDYQGTLFKINLATGVTAASSTAVNNGGNIGNTYAQMIYDSANDRIYLTNGAGHTAYAVKASDLSVIWSKTIESAGWVFYRGGDYHNNVFYVNIRNQNSTFYSKIYALDTQNNGNIIWVSSVPYDNQEQVSGSLVDDDYFYASASGVLDSAQNKLLLLNISDGSLAESIHLLHTVASSVPTVYGGRITIGLWDTFGYQSIQVRSGGSTGDYIYKGDQYMTGYVDGSSTGPLVARLTCDYSVVDPTKWLATNFYSIANCAGLSTTNLSSAPWADYVTSALTFTKAGTAIRIRAESAEAASSSWDTYAGLTGTIGTAAPVSFGEYNGNIRMTYDQNGSPQTVTGPVYSQDQYNTMEVKMNYPYLQFDVNDTPIATTTGWSTAYNNVPLKLGNYIGRDVVDWALARNYVYPEPAATFGSVTSISVPSSNGGGGGGGGGGGSYFVPAPTTTATSTGNIPVGLSMPENSGPLAFRLINSSGTFYLIINNVLHGITNPGMLYSYGFSFNQAKTATAQDLTLPKGDLLLPNDGALVKTALDKTVYLISRGQRHGFTSASVFLALGFKFSSVLIVTTPELNKQPIGSILNNPQSSHYDGLDINDHGTIYHITSQTRQAYPSLTIYNSWHILNDFSKVVPANAADLKLPVGSAMALRILQ